ncbi:MAG: hypothetical protein KDD15_32325 [Lewinella sp.]|nr:hypothetical protein [Lewinella sp.]
MEDYQLYLIVFMAGIIIGGFTGLSMRTGTGRRADWEYQNPGISSAYVTYPRTHSGFWQSVLIGLVILALALLYIRQSDPGISVGSHGYQQEQYEP